MEISALTLRRLAAWFTSPGRASGLQCLRPALLCVHACPCPAGLPWHDLPFMAGSVA